jgi:hypothetical protein
LEHIHTLYPDVGTCRIIVKYSIHRSKRCDRHSGFKPFSIAMDCLKAGKHLLIENQLPVHHQKRQINEF